MLNSKIIKIKKPSDILSLNRDDVTKSAVKYLFGNRKEGPRFSVRDGFILPKDNKLNSFGKDKLVSMGNYICNLILFNDNTFKIVGFIEDRFDKKVLNKIGDKLSQAVLEDDIETKDLIDYLNALQALAFSLNAIMTTSISEKTMFPIDSVMKRKEELFKEHKEELDKGDPVVANKIEKELLSMARKEIGDDDGMDIYDSGSKASFDNNYKLLNVMKGAIPNVNGGYYISSSNYNEGVKKEEIEHYANAMIDGQYTKSVGGTIEGGYLVKKYIADFQSVMLDKKGSDCGTTKTIRIKLTPFLKNILIDRYIKVGNKKVLLSNNIIDNYVGKYIDLYDPMYCCGDKLCNKCAGEQYYKLNIKNIGTTASKMGSDVLNKSMKKFHDSTIKIYSLKEGDIDDLVL